MVNYLRMLNVFIIIYLYEITVKSLLDMSFSVKLYILGFVVQLINSQKCRILLVPIVKLCYFLLSVYLAIKW